MRANLNAGPWSVTAETQMIDVTSSNYSYRESWRATDSNGHEHYYQRGFPTLIEVVDEQHWCDGNEGFQRHDPHMHVDKSHWECKLCGETVKPALDPPYTPKSIPGETTCTIEGPRSDGARIEAWLLPEEFDRLREVWEDQAAVLAIVDAIPNDRVYSTVVTSG